MRFFKKKEHKKALSRTEERDCINLLKGVLMENSIERMYNATFIGILKEERKLLHNYVDSLYNITKEKFLYEMEEEPTAEDTKEVKSSRKYDEDEDDRLQH